MMPRIKENHPHLTAKDFCVFGFEGNPKFNANLTILENELRPLVKKIEIFRDTLVSIEDGEGKLFLEDDDTGSSMLLEWWGAKYTTVATVDLASFITRINPKPKVLIIKADIEGMEFKLVPRLLVSGVLCDAESAFLAVEWHYHATLFPFKEFDAFTQAGFTDSLKFMAKEFCNVEFMHF